jgi:hypothetical protein
MSCRFCARRSLSFRRYRERSVDSVLRELAEVCRSGYHIIDFADDNPTASSRRFTMIMRGMIERNLHPVMTLNGWGGATEPILYRDMAEAGVRIISFGLESGDQGILDFYGKGLRLEQCRRAVESADRAGIFTAASFIFGAPMETDVQLEKTVAFARTLPLDFINIRVLEYVRGSPLAEELAASGRFPQDEPRVFAGRRWGLSPFTTEELEARCASAMLAIEQDPARQSRLTRKIARLGRPYQPSSHVLPGILCEATSQGPVEPQSTGAGKP